MGLRKFKTLIPCHSHKALHIQNRVVIDIHELGVHVIQFGIDIGKTGIYISECIIQILDVDVAA